MRLLYVSHFLSEKSNQIILEELSKIPDVDLKAITVDWYSKDKKHNSNKYDISYEKSFFGPHIYRYFFFPPLFLKARKINAEIIFADQEAGAVSTLQAMLWAKFSGAKFCFRSYENIFMKRRFPISLVESIVLKYSDFCFAGDKIIEKVLRKKGFKKRVFMAELGLSTKLFREKNKTAIKKNLGLKKFTISYFGRLNPEKSVETLILACARLKFDFQLIIDTFFADKNYLKKLESIAKEKRIFEKIVFIDPKHEDMPDYYNASDVVVIPSKSTSRWKEQFGRTIIEAMACEVPIIGSNSGSIPKVIGNAGLIFKQEDDRDLAGKITKIYSSPALRKKLLKLGITRVNDNFTWKKIAKKMVFAFEKNR